MARITDYATLQASAFKKFDNTEIEDQFDIYLQTVESRVNTMLREENMIEIQEVTTADEYLNNPDDWQEYIRIEVDGKYTLEYYPSYKTNTTVQPPTGYHIEGDRIRLQPEPDTDHTYCATYYKGVPALTDTTTENWLLTKFPGVYLNGVLAEAHLDLFDEQRANIFEQRFIRDINTITEQHDRTRYSGAPLKTRVR